MAANPRPFVYGRNSVGGIMDLGISNLAPAAILYKDHNHQNQNLMDRFQQENENKKQQNLEIKLTSDNQDNKSIKRKGS